MESGEMKKLSFLFAFAAAFIVMSSMAMAQDSSSVQPAAFEYYGLDDQESPSDQDVDDGTDVTISDSDCGCDSCCGLSKFGGCCCLGDAWEFYPEDCCGKKIGGWVQIGYHTRGDESNALLRGDGLFNDHPDHVQLQQSWLFVEKSAGGDSCCWDFGYRADFVYGTDGQDTQAFGGEPTDWDNDWDHGNFYGSAIPQLYVEMANCDWRVKAGHFFTIVGYEVVPSSGNFFYSKSLSVCLAEPFTHTGVLADYSVNDCLTVHGGYTAGWDTGYTEFGGDTYIGGFTYTPDDCSSLAYVATVGDFGSGPGGSDSDGYSHSIVYSRQLGCNFEYVFQNDHVNNQLFVNNGAAGLATNLGFPALGATTGQITSYNQYLFHTISDCLKLGTRLEWMDYGGTEIIETTFGVNYRPHANVVLRPEVRVYDFEKSSGLDDSTIFAVDAILTF
jgi:hypothetical protein